MKFEDLRTHVDNIAYRPSACNVRFGCDCGCGGDSYTYEHWSEGEQAADESIVALKAIGIIFENEE